MNCVNVGLLFSVCLCLDVLNYGWLLCCVGYLVGFVLVVLFTGFWFVIDWCLIVLVFSIL